jgi:hypothetical protein
LQLEHTSGQRTLFTEFIYGHFEGNVTPQGKKLPFYPTGSCSSHMRNVQEPSGFAAKKYAMKNAGGIHVLT